MRQHRSSSSSENPIQRREREQAERLAKLDKIVENSSEKNRNFFIAYLGLLIYVQAIIFSTTDLQLLVFSEGLKLPIIDLTVPLVGFYVVIPILCWFPISGLGTQGAKLQLRETGSWSFRN